MSELEHRTHIPQQSAWFNECIEFLTPPAGKIASESVPQNTSAAGTPASSSGPTSVAGPPVVPGSSSVVQDLNGATSTATVTASEDLRYNDILESMICKDFAHVPSWEDVTVETNLKKALTMQILIPLEFPLASSEGITEGVLLHGIPGCGKTYLCQALAKAASVTFFNVDCSSLISKWQGESEKWVVRML